MVEQSGFQIAAAAAQAYQDYNPLIMAPFVEAVIARVGIRPGDAVLDLACGTGLVTRRAAMQAGAEGRVVGLDLNPGMLAVARSLGDPTGASVAPIEWREGSALALPCADGEFDVVLCQQGIQFFPDLGLAASEMARVAAPGARLAVSFWAELGEQTYFQVQIAGLRRRLGPAVDGLAGAFRLDPMLVCDALTAAGFEDATAEQVVVRLLFPPMEHFAAGQVTTLPVAPAFAALDAAERASYVAEVTKSLARYRTAEGTYDCPTASWVVTATR